ncbi:S8 family serine peptidase [Plantibacter sp. ME-Dv--P-095]|uniref:S8 family serine peptidase n=1 Tax=Plantibacter sp. ME-Dv--P-095 TaxID=3040299 RepID=UPI00254EFB36|nr:S8 family serine peptidase [Plantibacter sp. ME-Dv--P-095]
MGVLRDRMSGVIVVALACCVVGAGAAPAGAATAACRSLPAPAVELLNAGDAATTFGVDGSGVRVGIISGSFGNAGDEAVAADVTAGLLPGPGNPCGYRTPVTLVDDPAGDEDDEGRAMAQLVHGIAPGAELLFASGTSDFPGAIDRLTAAGATIIVDDVQGGDDRRYRTGAGEAAIQRAVDAGVFYTTATGNFGVPGAPGSPSAGFPIGSWATEQYRPTSCPQNVADLFPAASVDCLDFDPGDPADPTMGVTLPPAALMFGVLDWAEPDGAVATRFEYVLSLADRTIPFTPSDPDLATGTAPLQNPSETEVSEVQVSVVRQVTATSGTPPVALTWLPFPDRPELSSQEYFRSTATDTVGSALFGHQAYPAAFRVAAVDAADSTLETYSSLGPSTILFGVQAPVTVSGPTAAGVDDLPVSTTVLTGSGNFRGTSAAAPTVAAAAALVRQLRPDLTPEQVRTALTDHARLDTITIPWDASIPTERSVGAGLIDVGASLQALASAAPSPSSPPNSGAAATDVLPPTGLSAVALLLTMGTAAAFIGGGLLLLARRRQRLA